MTSFVRGGSRAAVVLAAMAALSSTPARAQDYDLSAGWGGGYVKPAAFVESGAATPVDIGFEGTWVAVLQMESWRLNRRVGLRLGGFYSHGTVTLPDRNRSGADVGVEAAGLLRIAPPRAENSVTGYLMGGGGISWFQMDDRGEEIIPIAGSSVVYDADETRQFFALGGAGVEILPGWQLSDAEIGLRFEAVDHVTFGSPFRPVDGDDSGSKHNLRFTVTVFSGVEKLF